MRRHSGGWTRTGFALVLAALFVLPACPSGGSSELFKTSKGDTLAEVAISVPFGYNDSVSLSLPSAAVVQKARFSIGAGPVKTAAGQTDSGPQSFLNSSTLENLVFTNGSLGLANEYRSFAMQSWPAPGSNVTVSADIISISRNPFTMFFSPGKRAAPCNQSEYDPALAVGISDEIFLTWADTREYDFNIFFSRSLDKGATFSAAVKINDEGARRARQEFPDIAAGPKARLYIAYMDNRSGDEDICLASSPDGGATFSAPVRIDDGPAGTNQTHPSIAVDVSGKVAVAWEDNRAGNVDIRCAVSADGTTFPSSIQINTDQSGRGQYRPRLAAGPGGDFHAVWYDNRSGDFDIYYARHTLGAFLPEVRVDDTGTTGTFQALPSVCAGLDGTVHVVWHDLRYNDYRVMYSRSLDGLSFSANVVVDPQTGGGADQFQPRVKTGPDGTVHIVWHDWRSDDPNVYYCNSTDGGKTFNPPVRVDDGAPGVLSYSPVMGIISNGDVQVAWWDDRERYLGYVPIFQIFHSRGTHPYYRLGVYETGVTDLGTAPSGFVSFVVGKNTPLNTCVTALVSTSGSETGPFGPYTDCTLAGTPPGPAPARYFRVRLELWTTDPLSTPDVSSLLVNYTIHPVSGTYRSRPVPYPFAIRSVGAYWTEGKIGAGPAALTFFLSTNNGTTWQRAEHGLPVSFSGPGRILMYKTVFNGSTASTPTLSGFFADLRLESYPADVRLVIGRTGSPVMTRPGQMAPDETLETPELQEAFNRAISEARRAGQPDALIKLNFSSSAPGKLIVSNIRISYDFPPRILSREPAGPVGLNENQTGTFTITTEDPDSEILAVKWTIDGTVSASGTTGFAYTPTFEDSGVHNVSVTVSDGTLSATTGWTVTVNNVNRPPVIKRHSPEDRISLRVRDTARFELTASDLDGDLLTYSWNVSGNGVSSQDYFDFTAPSVPGTYSVGVQVSDGQDSALYSWTVDVYKPVVPPTIATAVDWPLLVGIVLLMAALAVGVRLLVSRGKNRGARGDGKSGRKGKRRHRHKGNA